MTVICSISILIIWVVTTINVGTDIMGIELSNIWIRILGVAELIALPFLGFTTVKRIKYKKDIKDKKAEYRENQIFL